MSSSSVQNGKGRSKAAQTPLPFSTSPVCTAEAYAQRSNKGQEVLLFCHNPQLGPDPVGRDRDVHMVSSHDDDDDEDEHATDLAMARCSISLSADWESFRYMHWTLEERAQDLDHHMETLGAELMKRYGVDEDELSPVGRASQEPVTVLGRICCEAEGKLNAMSLVLEGTRTMSRGERVKLDVVSSARLKAYSLFPGQIVLVRGMCPTGEVLVAHEILSACPPEAPRTSLSQLEEFNYGKRFAGGKPVSILAACGPYTTSGDQDYEPLEDLLGVVRRDKPDVLLLLGPFLDRSDAAVAKGRLVMEGAVQTMEEVFSFVYARVLVAVEGLPTRVVFVPDVNDAMHSPVFPQPPLQKPDLGDEGPQDPGQIIMAPNPCTLHINEVVVGVSCIDVLMHLSQEDTAKEPPAAEGAGKKATTAVPTPTKRSRLVRLAESLIEQRSYYPIFPPPPNAMVEMAQTKQFAMPCVPDIMILPSRLQHFAKVLNKKSTLCINPGRLTKGSSGGQYAQLNIHPLPREQLRGDDLDGSAEIPHDVVDRTRIKLIRI